MKDAHKCSYIAYTFRRVTRIWLSSDLKVSYLIRNSDTDQNVMQLIWNTNFNCDVILTFMTYRWKRLLFGKSLISWQNRRRQMENKNTVQPMTTKMTCTKRPLGWNNNNKNSPVCSMWEKTLQRERERNSGEKNNIDWFLLWTRWFAKLLYTLGRFQYHCRYGNFEVTYTCVCVCVWTCIPGWKTVYF